MSKNWDVIVKFHDCPNYYIDKGDRYCAHENGPQYCNSTDCPIANNFQKAENSPKRKLLKLSAAMAMCVNMPSDCHEDWNWPKGMQITSWRKVYDAAAKAQSQCKNWSVELSKIYESL